MVTVYMRRRRRRDKDKEEEEEEEVEDDEEALDSNEAGLNLFLATIQGFDDSIRVSMIKACTGLLSRVFHIFCVPQMGDLCGVGAKVARAGLT